MIRKMQIDDNFRVLEIFQQGIESRNSTFETDVPTWEEWDTKYHQHSRFVYLTDNIVVGWVAVTPTSSRFAYRGVAEVSIYVDNSYHSKGIGTKLMAELIKSTEENGIWTLVSSVFPENDATLKLHYKFGFRKVGYREKVASHEGNWRNTIVFERRSKIVGNT